MHENQAWPSSAQKIKRELERAKIFGTIDQHGIAMLQTLRQNLTRIPIYEFDIVIRPQFCFGRRRV